MSWMEMAGLPDIEVSSLQSRQSSQRSPFTSFVVLIDSSASILSRVDSMQDALATYPPTPTHSTLDLTKIGVASFRTHPTSRNTCSKSWKYSTFASTWPSTARLCVPYGRMTLASGKLLCDRRLLRVKSSCSTRSAISCFPRQASWTTSKGRASRVLTDSKARSCTLQPRRATT